MATRQRALPGLGPDEKRICLPSGIHVRFSAPGEASVRRLGSPPAVSPVPSGSQKSALPRRNAKDKPSAERAGLASPDDEGGGFVNCRLSPVSRDTTNSASGLRAPSESATTRLPLS